MNTSLQLKLDDELSFSSASLFDSGFQATYNRPESKCQPSVSFALRDKFSTQSTVAPLDRSVEIFYSRSSRLPESTEHFISTATTQRTNPRTVGSMDSANVQHTTSLLHKAADHKSLYKQLVSHGSLERQDLRSGENYRSSGKINVPVGASSSENTLRSAHNNTDFCLSMVNETKPSYRTKTSGKTPLSSSHLLSLVDTDLANNSSSNRTYQSYSKPTTQTKSYSKSTTSTHFDPDALFEELNDAVKSRSRGAPVSFQQPNIASPLSGQTQLSDKWSHKYTTTGTRPSPINRSEEAELDQLTSRLVHCMRTGKEECAKCGDSIASGKACTALEQTFHVNCFTCVSCGQGLAGKSFYSVEGKPYCESDYLETLEKCCCCFTPITDKVLRANGKAYHPACFVCSTCAKCLDGVPFTVDESNRVHCVTCFHEKYAPRCAVCVKPIVPEEGSQESVRIVALDKSFHVDCYRCEDCGLQLSSKVEGHECYPLDNHVLCKECSSRRIRQMTA